MCATPSYKPRGDESLGHVKVHVYRVLGGKFRRSRPPFPISGLLLILFRMAAATASPSAHVGQNPQMSCQSPLIFNSGICHWRSEQTNFLLGENLNSDRNAFRTVDCRPSIDTQGLVPKHRNREKKVSKSPNCESASDKLITNFHSTTSATNALFTYVTASPLE